jgi:hypothetical protein
MTGAQGIPEAALAILRTGPGPDEAFDQAIPLLTVDAAGFPHVALLSRGQLRPGRDPAELLAAVWGPGTRANLLARGRATVVLVSGQVAYYIKFTVASTVEHAQRLGVVLRMAGCSMDSAGVDLSPLGFRFSPELAEREGWEADAAVLDLLAHGSARMTEPPEAAEPTG